LTDSGPPEETSDSSDPIANGGPGTLLDPDLHDPDAELSSPQESSEPAEPARPGLRTFSLEHRVAPGLYLVAWLACLVGAGLLIVSVLSGPSVARTVLLVVSLLLLSLGLVAGAGQQTLERRARGWARYAGPSPFLVFAAVIPTSLLLALAAGYAFNVAGLGLDSGWGILVGSLATAAPSVVLVRLLVIGTGALTVADLGFVWPAYRVVRDLATGAAWALPVFLGTVLVAVVLALFLPLPPGPLPTVTRGPDRLAVFLVAVLIAPISEEIFFRGFATTAWARTMPRRAVILRSGVFFAFIHVLTVSGAATFQQGLGFAAFAFLVRLPVSFALAAVFLRRGSIYESFGLHAAYNAISLLISFQG
jgi:membrane protease YdiL (CAAX protease family)